jgi:drug/metabolite transporter (DMT)-like permease
MAWGCSFTWAKAAGDGMNQAAGLASGALFGPIMLLAWRFTAAALLWMLLFPAARRGWTWMSVWRSVVLGWLLWAGSTIQMLGLDRTSETVSAFLTSLSVVFVPLMMALGPRRPPPAAFWMPVGIATIGIWLMTGAAPTGFGSGEILGVGCAVIFSAHMIALGEVVRRDSPWRLAAGQFLVVGGTSALAHLYVGGDLKSLALPLQWAILTREGLWLNVVLLVIFSTMAAYGLMFHFQPRIDPTRAALIYLAEPIFAALFAYVAMGRIVSAMATLGAGLILLANVSVELLEWRHRRQALAATITARAMS